ncbi:MAG: YraN family protein [Prevotella sp.]|nr:YraN family protein [Prevotella sp.]MBR3078297.1 YraN family protein [Prevotella sp.]
MATHNELGKWGEDLAADYLQRKGYTIIERDWKSGKRDLDIIAQDGNVIVFVEVKTRRNRLFGEPEESVDYHKLQNLQQAISHYVKFKHIRQEIRFDIISIVGTVGTDPDIQHIQDVTLL